MNSANLQNKYDARLIVNVCVQKTKAGASEDIKDSLSTATELVAIRSMSNTLLLELAL